MRGAGYNGGHVEVADVLALDLDLRLVCVLVGGLLEQVLYFTVCLGEAEAFHVAGRQRWRHLAPDELV